MPLIKFLALSLCFSCSMNLSAASIKKWVDKDGVTQYGYSVPPQYINQEHRELNSRGIQTNYRNAAKSQQQIAEEKQLATLRKEKQRLIAEQKARDKILLNMFRSDEDLIMVRDGKVGQIDAQVKLKKSQLKRQKSRLSKQQKHAAEIERSGREIDPQLESNLLNSQKQIENSYAAILSKEQDKDRIRSRYNNDLERLRELRQRKNSQQTTLATAPTASDQSIKGIYYCQLSECDKRWQQSIRYAKNFITTELALSSPNIWMSKPAVSKKDISITLARIKANKQQQKIFLDLSCAENLSGMAFCKTASVQAITNNFHKYLKQQ